MLKKKYRKRINFYKKKRTDFYRKKSPYKNNTSQNSSKRKYFNYRKYGLFSKDYTKKSNKFQNKLN